MIQPISYPTWDTASNLGSVPSGSVATFTISASSSQQTTEFVEVKVISKTVPGTVVTNGASATLTLDGTSVDVDTVYNLTLRAKNSSGISDRNFTLKLLATDPIQWSQSGPLAVWPLGAKFRIPLTATWTWPLEYVLLSGKLPPGVFLDPSGTIYGIPGSDLQATSSDPSTWEVSGPVSNTMVGTYTFTIRAQDAKTGRKYQDRTFTISTINSETLSAGVTEYTADSTALFASSSSYLPVVILEDFDGLSGVYRLGEYRHDNEFIRQIKYWNPKPNDQTTLEFSLLSQINAYDNLGYDTDAGLGFDGYGANTVPFLSIEPANGYLFGSLPQINANRQRREFSVLLKVETSSGETYQEILPLGIDLLGEFGISFEFLDDYGRPISPNTTYDLKLSQGEISDLKVSARWIDATVTQLLFFELASGGLPAGITLSPNGLLMGQVNWDAEPGDYRFSVRVYDPSLDQSVYSTKFSQNQEYRLTVSRYVSGVTPVDRAYDIYYRAYLPLDQRIIWQNVVTDPRIFSNSIVYRAEDENYGRRLECEFLAFTGIAEHEVTEFSGAISKNWDLKRFRLGEVRSAIMRNSMSQHVCDVIYVEMSDPHTNSQRRGPPLATKIRTTNSAFAITSDNDSITVDEIELTTDAIAMRELYPATIDNQLQRLRDGPGQVSDSILPKWMTTPQGDGRPLGQEPAAILCFVEPGRGDEVLRKIRNSTHRINQIDFHVDRLVLRRAPSSLLLLSIDSGDTTFDNDTTTFDIALLRDKYIYFRTDGAIYDINN